jgi:hypothetical protein
MRRVPGRRCVGYGLLTVMAGLAPAWQDPPPPPTPANQEAPAPAPNSLEALGKARVAAAVKTFELSWLYYSENRIDASDVYSYSRLRLMAEQDSAIDKAGRVEATRGHRERMAKLWNKVARVKKLGFSNTLDVNEAEYYLREAEFWIAREQAWDEK